MYILQVINAMLLSY